MRFWPLLWSNLTRRKLRAACTGLSIAVAMLLVGALLAVREGFASRDNPAGAERLVVGQRTAFTQPLPLAHRAALLRVPGVAAVTCAAWFRGVYRDARDPFPQLAVDPETWFEMYTDLWQLPPEQLARWRQTRSGAVVGVELARRFGWQLGDRVALRGGQWPKRGGGDWEFTIEGIYGAGPQRSASLDLFFFHYGYLDEARAAGSGLVDTFRVRASDSARADALAKAIDAVFANSAFETRTANENAFIRAIAEQLGDVGAIVAAILAPVLFTLLLLCGHGMSQAVRERTRELALLKALGWTGEGLLALVLAESCALPLVGGALGLGLWRWLAGGALAGSPLPLAPLGAAQLATCAAGLLGLGILAGAAPARRAQRLEVADGLRQES
jgi:putative ABC transport system permease protein